MTSEAKLEEIKSRIEKLGFYCPVPPLTHVISGPVYALLCMPMHQVAVALALRTDEEVEESVIEDLFGVKNVRESFALGNEVAELPVNEIDAVVLRKMLVGRRAVDAIIYEFALETISMFFEVANEDVVEFAKLIIARTIVSIAQASGSGWFGMGSEATPEQLAVIETICETLALRKSPSAAAALDQFETKGHRLI